ncbi:hypothetical protein SDC9_96956 [bioreactor metagenome]|uniref:Uncharacterized protein n=1 Tax=bioreactor metagenome TaxID=1076179 RepID=A0A645AAJ4_9ZZZZ
MLIVSLNKTLLFSQSTTLEPLNATKRPLFSFIFNSLAKSINPDVGLPEAKTSMAPFSCALIKAFLVFLVTIFLLLVNVPSTSKIITFISLIYISSIVLFI